MKCSAYFATYLCISLYYELTCVSVYIMNLNIPNSQEIYWFSKEDADTFDESVLYNKL